MITVDARGCSCPQPVLMTKKALEKEEKIKVLVDNNTAKENVSRFARNKKYSLSVEDGDAEGEYNIIIAK